MSKTIRCAIYDRVSTDIQVQNGLSLDTQRELLTKYANDHGYKIVDYYADEGITARKKLKNRKDFLRLIEDVKQDKIDMILVTKLDRWFRNVKDYHNTQAILEEHNCNWKTILEDYDTTTADGQLKINIMLAVAQNESDRTSERIKVVFEHKRRNMEHITGSAPFGYITVDKKLQQDPKTKDIVRDIFEYYFTCFSKRKTIFYIIDKYGEDSPTNYQINRILSHELYAGLYQGKPGYCEPYITCEQHREILNTCSSKTYPATKEPYLFSQLIKCPHCGAVMSGFVRRQKLKNGGVSMYKRYRCSRKLIFEHPVGACITESVIEDYMINNVGLAIADKLHSIKNGQQKPRKKDNTKKIQAEIERLNILFQKGRISDEYYDIEYEKLSQQLKKQVASSKEVSQERLEAIQKQFSGQWVDLYKQLSPEYKKVFWKRTIKEIYIDSETHKICGFDFLI